MMARVAGIDFRRGVGRVEIEAARQAIDQDRPGTGLDDGGSWPER